MLTTKKCYVFFLCMVVISVLTALPASANPPTAPVVGNPSFETTDYHIGYGCGNIANCYFGINALSPQMFPGGPDAFAPWTFTGGSGVALYGSAVGAPPLPDGKQYAILSGISSVSQIVSGFTPGQNYVLSFWLARRTNYDTGQQTVSAAIGGISHPGINVGTQTAGFVQYQIPFTAQAETLPISFNGVSSSTDSALLDQVGVAPLLNANSSFETTDFHIGYGCGDLADCYFMNPNYPLGLNAFAPWTFSGASGVSLYGSYFFGNPQTSRPMLPDGKQFAVVSSTGSVSQAIDGFIPGNMYVVTFWLAKRQGGAGNGPGNQTVNVTLGSTQLASLNAGALNDAFVKFALAFQAAMSSETLTFAGTSTSGDTAFLDQVLVTPYMPQDRPPVAAAAPIADANPSFETTDFHIGYGCGNLAACYFMNPSYPLGLNAFAPWTFSGASGVSLYGSYFFGNPQSSKPTLPNGKQFAVLSKTGAISQPLSGLVPGTRYILSFWGAKRLDGPGNGPGNQTVNVSVNGVCLGSIYVGVLQDFFVRYSFAFTATTTSDVLQFAGTSVSGDSAFVDQVLVTKY